jgi:hypothetical protein
MDKAAALPNLKRVNLPSGKELIFSGSTVVNFEARPPSWNMTP